MMIQERDKQILRRCYEQQFLLMEHVERFFFKGVEARNARQRILEMEQVGWLKKEPIAGLSKRQIIRVTPEGARLAESIRGSEISQRRRLDLNTLEHDALVTTASFRLAELWEGTWIPECAIDAGEYPHVPDGVFIFSSGKCIPVEVENSVKGKSRFMGILARWRELPVFAILYIATSPEIRKALQKFISEGPRGLPCAVVLWKDLEMGSPLAWSVRGDVDLFGRREF